MKTLKTIVRPAWTIQKQTAIIVRDSSDSMQGQKALDVEAATNELVRQLGMAVNKNAFEVVIIDFNDQARLVVPPTPAVDVAVPALCPESRTDFTSALEMAEKISIQVPVEQAIPVILFLSDGEHNEKGDPNAIAERLKERADIVTVAFGSGADTGLLLSMATSPQHFAECLDGVDLQSFFTDFGTTVVASSIRGERFQGVERTRTAQQSLIVKPR